MKKNIILSVLILGLIVLFSSEAWSRQPVARRYTEIRIQSASQGKTCPLPEKGTDQHLGHSHAEEETGPAGLFHWLLPEGWSEQKGDEMRLATFFPPDRSLGVESSLIVLAGKAGDFKNNVRRWAGQLGDASLADQIMEGSAESVIKVATSNGQAATLIDFSAVQADDTQGSMIVGLIDLPDQTVFLKMIGPKKEISGLKGPFIQLLKSLKRHVPGESH